MAKINYLGFFPGDENEDSVNAKGLAFCLDEDRWDWNNETSWRYIPNNAHMGV